MYDDNMAVVPVMIGRFELRGTDGVVVLEEDADT